MQILVPQYFDEHVRLQLYKGKWPIISDRIEIVFPSLVRKRFQTDQEGCVMLSCLEAGRYLVWVFLKGNSRERYVGSFDVPDHNGFHDIGVDLGTWISCGSPLSPLTYRHFTLGLTPGCEPWGLHAHSPLFHFLLQGSMAGLKLLEKNQPFLEQEFYGDENALMIGVPFDHVRRYLLQGGVDVHAANASGATALMYAAGQNNPLAVRDLLQAGAKVNAQTDHCLQALHFAVRSSDGQSVALLLAAGAEIETPDDQGNRPLMQAVKNRNLEIAELLLVYGATPNIVNPEGEDPLKVAILSNQVEMVRLLLRFGAPMDWGEDNFNVFGNVYFAIQLLPKKRVCMEDLLIEAGFRVDSVPQRLRPNMNKAFRYYRQNHLDLTDDDRSLVENALKLFTANAKAQVQGAPYEIDPH